MIYKNCTEKLNYVPSQVVTSANECTQNLINSIDVTCSVSRKFTGDRAYYWFIVFSRCRPSANSNKVSFSLLLKYLKEFYFELTKGVSMKYYFELTNGDGYFDRHFSADEMGILETCIFMFIFYFLMVIITLVYARILALKRLLHTTFKMFLASLIIEFFSVMFTMIDYTRLASTGKFVNGLTLVGRLFSTVSSIIFLLMLILLAKGYTVTRGKLRKVTVIKIVVLFSLYTIAYTVAFIYSEAVSP